MIRLQYWNIYWIPIGLPKGWTYNMVNDVFKNEVKQKKLKCRKMWFN